MKEYKQKLLRLTEREAAYLDSLKLPDETMRELVMRLGGRPVKPLKLGRPRKLR